MNMVSQVVTPDDLRNEQDQLLSAGSKISFRDIYNQEIELPLYKKKFYKADDVDNLFVLINGVLTDVSEHAHRGDKALTAARVEASAAEEIAHRAVDEVERLENVNKDLLSQIEHLRVQMNELIQTTIANQESAQVDETYQLQYRELEKSHSDLTKSYNELQEAYNRMLVSSSDKLTEFETELSHVLRDKESLQLTNDVLSDDNAELKRLLENEKNTNTVLTSENSMLQYKLDKVQSLSKERIENLIKEINILKGA